MSASEAARELADRPSDLLRLAVPRGVVPILLEPTVPSFCRAFPEVQVEIVATGRNDGPERPSVFCVPIVQEIATVPQDADPSMVTFRAICIIHGSSG